jgi:Xaa-Pro aminopeptidase
VLKTHLAGMKRVAMEYSPGAAIPTSAAWTRARSRWCGRAGVEVVSSADLVQHFEARWTPEQKALHDRAARDTLLAKDEASRSSRSACAARHP